MIYSSPLREDRLFLIRMIYYRRTRSSFMLLGCGGGIICTTKEMFPGLDLYCTDPVQHFITAGYDLDDVYVDGVSVDDVCVDV